MKRKSLKRRRGTARRRGASLVVALVLAALAFSSEMPMAASALRSGWMQARRAEGSPAIAQMAGSFRVVAANALWLKVDAYHHEWEERGLDWTKNGDLIPLLRAVTYLDPHFVIAYEIHSRMLIRQGKATESLALLREGVRNNPKSFEVHEALGLLYAWNLKRPNDAIPWFSRAHALATDPFDRNRIARTLRVLTSDARGAVMPITSSEGGS